MIAQRRVLLILIFLVMLFERVISEEYNVGFNEGFKDCDGFSNKKFKAENMQIGKDSENGEDSTFLTGYFEFCEEIDEGCMINMKISKETEVGDEPMWSCSADVCASIKDKKAPWAKALETMGITECPIKTGKYACENMTLDMGFMNDMLDEKYEGSYKVMIGVENAKQEEIACHNVGLAISGEH